MPERVNIARYGVMIMECTRMAFYRCSICQDDGTPVVDHVTVTLEVGSDDEKWYGTITATHQADLSPGRRYRLTLEDGRVGEFVVRRNTFAGSTDRAIAINGTAPLK
jgi:hypothetical protein